jgi:hypothetical protein
MSEYTMISAITPSNYDKNTLYLHRRDITKIRNRASLPSQPGPTYPIFGEWTIKDSTGVSLLRSTTWPGI